MSSDNLKYVIRKAHPLLGCFVLLVACKKTSGVFSLYQQSCRHTKGIGSERREMQSVTMHAGLCDAAYCLVSVKKRAQRLYGHVAHKRQRADSVFSCR